MTSSRPLVARSSRPGGRAAWPPWRRWMPSGRTARWTRRATVNAARSCSVSSSGSTASSTAEATFLAVVRDWLRDDRFRPARDRRRHALLRPSTRTPQRHLHLRRGRSRRAARAERRGQVDAAGCHLHADRPKRRGSPLRLAHRAVGRRTPAPAAWMAGPRAAGLSRADGPREPAVLRAPDGRRRRARLGRPPRSPRRGWTRAPTSPSRVSRAACASGWRSSGR